MALPLCEAFGNPKIYILFVITSDSLWFPINGLQALLIYIKYDGFYRHQERGVENYQHPHNHRAFLRILNWREPLSAVRRKFTRPSAYVQLCGGMQGLWCGASLLLF